jgi:hypothetical protein
VCSPNPEQSFLLDTPILAVLPADKKAKKRKKEKKKKRKKAQFTTQIHPLKYLD